MRIRMRIRLLINRLVVILLCCCMAAELTACSSQNGQAVYGLLYEQFKGQAYRTEL